MDNFQFQITRKNDVLPMTLDYKVKDEKALAMHEMAHGVTAPPEPARPRAKKAAKSK
jgi:cyclopropane-fatty-acyl-phospholipid synthase